MHRKDLTLLLATQMQRYPHVMPGPCQVCPSWQGHGLRPQDPAVQLSSCPAAQKSGMGNLLSLQPRGAKMQGARARQAGSWPLCDSGTCALPGTCGHSAPGTSKGLLPGEQAGVWVRHSPWRGKWHCLAPSPLGKEQPKLAGSAWASNALKSITDEGYRVRGRIPQGDGGAEHSSSHVTNRLEGRGGQAGPWGGTGMAGCRM